MCESRQSSAETANLVGTLSPPKTKADGRTPGQFSLSRLGRHGQAADIADMLYFGCGLDLGMPHTRAMGSGLFELRLKATEGIARVFYCTVVDRRIVVLHQFVKKTAKTPARELQIARRRKKDVCHD